MMSHNLNFLYRSNSSAFISDLTDGPDATDVPSSDVDAMADNHQDEHEEENMDCLEEDEDEDSLVLEDHATSLKSEQRADENIELFVMSDEDNDQKSESSYNSIPNTSSTQFTETWRTLGSSILNLRQREILCDVKLVPSDFHERQVIIHAHALVLAAGSRYFQQLFGKRKSEFAQVVEMHEINTEVLQIVVDCIYGDLSDMNGQLEQLQAAAPLIDSPCVDSFVANHLEKLECKNELTVKSDDEDVVLPPMPRTMKLMMHQKMTQGQLILPRTADVPAELPELESAPSNNSCLKCQLDFSSVEDLITHLWQVHKVELPVLPMKCTYCGEVFMERTALDEHNTNCSKKPKLPLRELVRKTDATTEQSRKTAALTSKEEATSGRVVVRRGKLKQSCYHCKLCFTEHFKFLLHIHKEHSSHRYYFCSICGLRVCTHKRAVAHVEMAHGITATYVELRALNVILTRWNIRKIPVMCFVMEDSNDDKVQDFASSWLATRFICMFCSHETESTASLVEHIQEHLIQEQLMLSKLPTSEYECQECGLLHDTKPLLDRHVFATHIEKYVCKHCGRRFHGSANLMMHMRSHGDRKFLCEVCDKAFVQLHHLTDHMKIHSDVRQYSCEVCGMQFKWRQALKTHFDLLHNPDFVCQFICDICGHNFPSKHRLGEHKVSHSDARPFACNVCGKSYKKAVDMKRHRRIHPPTVSHGVRVHKDSTVGNILQEIKREIKPEISQSDHQGRMLMNTHQLPTVTDNAGQSLVMYQQSSSQSETIIKNEDVRELSNGHEGRPETVEGRPETVEGCAETVEGRAETVEGRAATEAALQMVAISDSHISHIETVTDPGFEIVNDNDN